MTCGAAISDSRVPVPGVSAGKLQDDGAIRSPADQCYASQKIALSTQGMAYGGYFRVAAADQKLKQTHATRERYVKLWARVVTRRCRDEPRTVRTQAMALVLHSSKLLGATWQSCGAAWAGRAESCERRQHNRPSGQPRRSVDLPIQRPSGLFL